VLADATNNCDNVAASKREKQLVSSRLIDLAKCPGVCAVEGLKTLSLSLSLSCSLAGTKETATAASSSCT